MLKTCDQIFVDRPSSTKSNSIEGFKSNGFCS